MRRNSIDTLGELQRAVMELVWELGEASVHDVRERLESQKKLAYTTVLTVLQKLEKSGWLSHRSQSNHYIYIYLPTRSRDEAGAGSVRGFLKRVFDGDAVTMFQHLIRESDLTDEDLRELRKMINEKKRELQ